MLPGLDQTYELSVLDGDDGCISPDSPQRIECIQLEYFDCSVVR